jgi:hypothetical protein
VDIQTCANACGATKGPALTVNLSSLSAATTRPSAAGPTGGVAEAVEPRDASAVISGSTVTAVAGAPGSSVAGVDALGQNLSILRSTVQPSVPGGSAGATAVGVLGNQSAGVATIANSTINGDGSADAAVTGIDARTAGSALTVEQSTITRNGVGLHVGAGSAAIEADVVAGNGADCTQADGPIFDDRDNIDSDGSCGLAADGTSVSHSPTIVGSLAPLADNGGPTQTVGLFAGSPAHDLVSGSLTLASDGTTACANADQRGVARPGAGHPCDAGAFQGTLASGGSGGGGAGQAPAVVSVASSDGSSVFGEPVSFTGTVSPAPSCGAVSWLVDNVAQGSPIPVSQGSHDPAQPGAVIFTFGPVSDLDVGAHPVTLAFPGCGTVGEGSGEVVQVVAKRGTKTTVTVDGSTYTATVQPDPPGGGTPTGSVTFFVNGSPVGTSPLGPDGTATFRATSSPSQRAASSHAASASQVTATYSGDAHFEGSTSPSAGAGGRPPTIKASVTSAHPKTAAGWYRSPVTVTYTCTAGSAPFAAPGCPQPVTLRHSGAAQSVTATVRDTDGGSASVTVSPINIDRTPPVDVRLHGAAFGATYSYAQRHRTLRCSARDRLSGVASCIVRTTAERHGRFVVVRYVLTATNNAGGISAAAGSYRYRAHR